MGRLSFSPPPLSGHDPRRVRMFAGLMVFLVTLLTYLPSLHNGFTDWDDDLYVYANPHIQAPTLQAPSSLPFCYPFRL